MHDVSRETFYDLARLQLERPTEWFQKQLGNMHTERAEAYSSYLRHRDSGVFLLEAIAWQRYCALTNKMCELTKTRAPIGTMTTESTAEIDVRGALLRNTCDRCGFVWTYRQPRFVDGLCSSCSALREVVLRRGRFACQPWQGRFADDDVTPVNGAGSPILPGPRYCGNSDCVNPKHIKKGRMKNV